MTTNKRGASFNTTSESTRSYSKFTTMHFNDVSEPGAYYNHDTGWLYRVPDDVLAPGHSPLMNIVSMNENFVTKISDDPYIPIGKARQICSNLDWAVNF